MSLIWWKKREVWQFMFIICMCAALWVENKSLAIDWYIKWIISSLCLSLAAAAAVWYNQQYQFCSAALCVSICFMCYVWWSSAMLKWFIDWLLVDQKNFFFYVIPVDVIQSMKQLWNVSSFPRFYFAKKMIWKLYQG